MVFWCFAALFWCFTVSWFSIALKYKVTSSLAAIHRLGHWVDNCKMPYYKGLYGNLRTCLRVENIEHKWNKNALPCLLDNLSVILWRTSAISARLQWVVGLLFSSFYIYLTKENSEPTTERSNYKVSLGYLGDFSILNA